MNGDRLARIFRAVRIRLGWRQVDVARRASVSDAAVSRIERGRLQEVSLATLIKVAEVLEIRLEIVARWRGGDLDRMINAKHAALTEDVVAWILEQPGWEVRPEVSFNVGGERGVIELLAWHSATRTLLVIELKTEIVDVGELLGTFDRKRRIAWRVAAGLGWRPDRVGVALLVREGRTNRRRVAAHQRTLRAALPDSGRRLRAFLAAPSSELPADTGGSAATRDTDAPDEELGWELAAAARGVAAPARGLSALSFVPDRQQTRVGPGPATNRRVRVATRGKAIPA